jgi:Putative transposase
VACYLVRAPLSLKKLVYLDGQKAVLYRSRMNPTLGRNFEAMDPLEWLARMSDHIPDPGKHRTHFYANYANRVRGERPPEEVTSHGHGPEQPKRRPCSPSWARLIAKVFQADPLVCRHCGGPLKVLAYVTDSVAIRQILDHLDLSPLEKPPPPDVREVVRVPVDDEGREIAVNPA